MSKDDKNHQMDDLKSDKCPTDQPQSLDLDALCPQLAEMLDLFGPTHKDILAWPLRDPKSSTYKLLESVS